MRREIFIIQLVINEFIVIIRTRKWSKGECCHEQSIFYKKFRIRL